MPDNLIKLLWDTLLIAFIFVNTLLIPLNLCFGFNSGLSLSGEILDKFEIFLVYLIGVDMALSLVTAFYSKGVIITNHTQIVKNYLSSLFLWDFLSVLPYFLNPFLNYDYIKLFLLLRLIKMTKIFSSIEERIFLSNKIKGIYDLSKLMLLIIYVSHFFACGWIYIAQIQINNGILNTWIQNFKLSNMGWEDQYIASLYFAVYTMVTVGYGDIYPTNFIEKILCIVFMLLACCVFAYALNRFGTILQEMYKDETKFK